MRTRLKVSLFPDDSALFQNSGRAFVGISLNNRIMSSPELLSVVLDWSTKNVGDFDLLVGDYLNRYNYQAFDGATEEMARQRANCDGAEARLRLYKLISPHGSFQSTIISTRALYERSSFRSRFADFWQHYSRDSEFRSAVEEGVDAFLARRHPLAISDSVVRNYCVAYQLEELVLFEQLAEEGYRTFIYPGAQLPIMKMLVDSAFSDISQYIHKLTLVELRLFEDDMP